ncbi:uncharacterized protein LOC126690333 [Quercus robur]|uniref:uncharacterized protein LOC126690333 n=1 Tax=Quercus robur TaxID=38942 RepID=UPI002163918B|nr:uncharacterized protein LOC126690333 [Quercus robur]
MQRPTVAAMMSQAEKRLWRKTSVLRQPIDVCHIRVHLKKQYELKNKKEFTLTASSASFTPFLRFLHAEPPPPPHRSPEQNEEKKKEFSPCPLLPPLGLYRPLLAQTSTTPHTGAHCHRVRRSCAWSLETNRSHREPRCKGGSTLADLQRALEDYLPVLLGLVKDGSHLQYKVQFVWANQEDDAEETGMSNAWYEVLSVLHLMAMLLKHSMIN